MLASIPGCGRKTAERIVVELKDRIEKGSIAPDGYVAGKGGTRGGPLEEAMAALMALGYSRPEAQEAVSHAAKEMRGTPGTTEEVVRAALTATVA